MLWSKTLGKGDNLVLLHGWGFNSDIFADIKLHNYKLTLIDLPGHGRSPIIMGGLEEWVNAIIKIIPKNSIIVGWSLGGLIAIKIAQQIKVKKLVLLASSPCFVNSNNWEYGIKRDIFSEFYKNLQHNTEKTLKQFTLLQSNNKQQAKNLYQQICQYKVQQIALKIGLDILLNNNLTQELLSLNCPIQAILGKKDTLVPIKIKDWYQDNYIQTIIYDSGHLPFLNKNFIL